MKDCVFCKIVSGDVPSKKVYEDKDIYVFKDIQPHAPVHDLIIPKKHFEKLIDLKASDKDLLGNIVLVANKVAKKEKIQKAYKLVVNNGRFAGQVIMHLHFHLLGGWKEKSDVKSELKQ